MLGDVALRAGGTREYSRSGGGRPLIGHAACVVWESTVAMDGDLAGERNGASFGYYRVQAAEGPRGLRMA